MLLHFEVKWGKAGTQPFAFVIAVQPFVLKCFDAPIFVVVMHNLILHCKITSLQFFATGGEGRRNAP